MADVESLGVGSTRALSDSHYLAACYFHVEIRVLYTQTKKFNPLIVQFVHPLFTICNAFPRATHTKSIMSAKLLLSNPGSPTLIIFFQNMDNTRLKSKVGPVRVRAMTDVSTQRKEATTSIRSSRSRSRSDAVESHKSLDTSSEPFRLQQASLRTKNKISY